MRLHRDGGGDASSYCEDETLLDSIWPLNRERISILSRYDLYGRLGSYHTHNSTGSSNKVDHVVAECCNMIQLQFKGLQHNAWVRATNWRPRSSPIRKAQMNSVAACRVWNAGTHHLALSLFAGFLTFKTPLELEQQPQALVHKISWHHK